VYICFGGRTASIFRVESDPSSDQPEAIGARSFSSDTIKMNKIGSKMGGTCSTCRVGDHAYNILVEKPGGYRPGCNNLWTGFYALG
jgi:hypothetical protein